jgi:hypothetical protein
MARPTRGRHRRGQPRAGLSIPFGEVSCRIEMLVERPRHFQPGPCRGTRIQPDPPHGSPDLRVRSLGDRPQKTDSMGRRATWIGQRSRTSADTTRLRPDQLSSLRRKTAGHHASTCPPELLLPPPRSGIMPASVLLDGARCGVSPPTGGTRGDCGETTHMNGIRIRRDFGRATLLLPLDVSRFRDENHASEGFRQGAAGDRAMRIDRRKSVNHRTRVPRSSDGERREASRGGWST